MRIWSALALSCLISACGGRPSEPSTDAGPDGLRPDGPAGCAECADNLSCTEDRCVDGTCKHELQVGFCLIAGVCYADGATDPKNGCARCMATPGADTWTLGADGSACDDGQPCTKKDTCQSGTCQGIAYSCAPDWLDCTADSCDGAGGCTYPASADSCAITDDPMAGPRCYKKGERSQYMPPGTCQACDPAKSQTAWSEGAGCTIAGMCYLAGEHDPSGCQVCDPAKNATTWSPATSACQIAGKCYQAGDKDPSGCNVCDPAKSASNWAPAAMDCKVGGLCYKAGDKDTLGCNVCDPTKSTTAWTALAVGCRVYGKCYAVGDKDAQGCGVCDPSKSATSWTPLGSVCQIGGKCYADGAVSAGGCGICDVAKSANNWSPVPGTCAVTQYPAPPPPYPQQTQCLKAGEKLFPGACEVCDPSRSPTSLSPVTSSDCKIDGMCLNNGDGPPGGMGPKGPVTTCAVCDATASTTNWTILAGTCFIYGQCFQGGELEPTGCGVCDPTKSATEWSPMSGKCNIPLFPGPGPVPTQCFDNGAKHPTGDCAVCDTSKSASSWTLLGGCLIGDPYAPPGVNTKCYKAGDVEPMNGCGVCDPTKSATEWSPVAGKCAIPQYFGGPPMCFADGAQHPSGSCAVCDTTKSSTDWTVVGDCLISDGKMEQCFSAGATDPMTGCGKCDPAQSHTSWTPLSGKCMIAASYPGGPPGPTMCYSDGAQHPTGPCAKCDTAKSPSSWTIVAGCLISEQCFPQGAPGPNGCQVCDPVRSTVDWSPASGKCAIPGAMPCTPDDPATPLVNEDTCPIAMGSFCVNGFCLTKGGPSSPACYADGANHPTGACAKCDAAQSATTWTVVSGCLIDDRCLSGGAKDPSGCLQCDAARPLAWSAIAGVDQTELHFDDGTLAGVTLSAKSNAVGWQLSTARKTTGTHALYYGDPAAGSFDTPNAANKGSATLPAVALPANKKALLVFSLWMDTDLYAYSDRLEVKVGSDVVWSKSEVTYPVPQTWRDVVVDLSSRAGQSVTISFAFDTVDPNNNVGEGVYVDAIRVLTGCP